VLDHWLESVAGNRQQVDPEQIPWAALRVMLSQSTYGARIDNAFDQKVLDSFVETIYVPESFDIGFKPAPSAPEFPEATSMEGLVQWVADLPGIHAGGSHTSTYTYTCAHMRTHTHRRH
jgi:dynein heavy chain 1, cytosolic